MSVSTIGSLFGYVIGGGWGAETPSDGTIQTAIIRGADFPSVALQDVSGLPVRFESSTAVEKRALRPGDIVFEISGGTKDRPTGRSVFVSHMMIESSPAPIIPASFCRLIRPDPTRVEPRWLYYRLQAWWNDGGAWEYQNQSTGISNFRFKVFEREYSVDLPDVGAQQAVSEVLGALDDKIAMNRTWLLLVSQLLIAKYRSYAKSRDGATFGDVADVGGGATPSTKKPEFWGKGIAWATPTDITGLDGIWLDRTDRTISPAGMASISSPLYPTGSIAMTSRATIGACALLGEPMAVNQGFIVLQPKDQTLQLWLYYQLLDRVDEFKAWANGATFLELPKKIFRRLPVELGSEADMDEFAAFATPLMDRVHALQLENHRLAATRDELLPLLMSGKITVKDAEKTIEEVV
ncbi:restriction endonuclease subunit S [Brachybacterium tyrofermentans]|uniref:restriction endonuclease subunit S n=1 Tax=Brachybacterium tyrofermentans TaxID=47848 RepID=UPI003F8FAFB2